ncbi:hypothetical protein DITRI_Ditri02bG0139900 [Diplodiscus trichospermus]
MVFKKMLDYGVNAFNVPNVPRAPRSIRRRGRTKRTMEHSQICAFELLASLAGKLLQESESSASSNASERHDHVSIGKDVKQEILYDDKPLKTECVERGSCEVSVVASESTTKNSDNLKEFSHAEKKAVLERTPTETQAGCLEQITDDLRSSICKRNVAYGSFLGNLGGYSPNLRELFDGISENGVEQEREAKDLETEALSIANICPSKEPLDLSTMLPASNNSDRDVKLPSRSNSVRNASFSTHRNENKLSSRDDDDENFSRFNKLSYRFRASRPPTSIGNQRIRKLLTSKYWKVAPKLKDFEHSIADEGIKPLHHKRKTYYNYERCQYDTLCKRRKFFDHSSIVTSDGGISSESVSNSPEKVMNGDKSSSMAVSHGACGISSLLRGHQASHQSNDTCVKFSIKSFRIPELYIEVSETATVGSLKKTVMEAVTALLGGGIRVGVLLQGKKVRDDSRTLSQTGISCEDNLDALGFTLEPGPAKAPPPVCSEVPSLQLSYDAAPQNITSSPAIPAVDTGISNATPDAPLLTYSADPVDSHETVSSQTDMLSDQNLPESRALVPVPAMNVEALAIVPVNQKIRKSDFAQRRTRRPFSVSEVEALVQAVEELGSGRWRDVKLRAFENADHRTYVDLKDKWKTLVHTAKISPQQRRGEPVPQELLDRVLAAHAYWSQHQAKQQGKHHPGTLRIADAQADGNGVAAIPTVTM